MNKTVTIDVNEKLLWKQVKYFDQIVHSKCAYSDSEEQMLLEGLLEMCHCVLDECGVQP